MSKIVRKTMKQFGSGAPSQMGQFGSFAAGAPATSVDPGTIQSLGAYTQGWFSAIVAGQSPALEDMNALAYLFAYQLGYLLQTGIGEYDAFTPYFIGSIVNDGTGILYVSLTDNNLGNALAVGANWRRIGGGATIATIDPGTTPTYTVVAADLGKTFLVNTVNGTLTVNLPEASANTNFVITIKDVGIFASVKNITVVSVNIAGQKIEGAQNFQNNYICASDGGMWTFVSDGTSWNLI